MQGADFIDLIKLRASYGELGNDAGIGYYASQGLYSLGHHQRLEAKSHPGKAEMFQIRCAGGGPQGGAHLIAAADRHRKTDRTICRYSERWYQ